MARTLHDPATAWIQISAYNRDALVRIAEQLKAPDLNEVLGRMLFVYESLTRPDNVFAAPAKPNT